MTSQQNRSRRKRSDRRVEIIIGGLIFVLLLVVANIATRGKYLKAMFPAPDETQAALSSVAATGAAHLSFSRVSDVGDKVEYVLDCPGTELCIVEIRQNEVAIAKAEVRWDTVQSFFIQYSNSPMILNPVLQAGKNSRILAQWQFSYEDVNGNGVITDQSEYSGALPYWEAMILSFI